MLEGVYILSEVTKFTQDINTLVGGIIIGILSLVFIVCGIICFTDKENGSGLICSLLFIFCGGISFLLIGIYINKVEYKEYKITIDDNVKMNDFFSKYNITNQEGKIYTITKKNEESSK